MRGSIGALSEVGCMRLITFTMRILTSLSLFVAAAASLQNPHLRAAQHKPVAAVRGRQSAPSGRMEYQYRTKETESESSKCGDVL